MSQTTNADKCQSTLKMTEFGRRCFSLGFQLALACFLFSSLWRSLGLEPASWFELHVQLLLIGVSACLVAGLWIFSTTCRFSVKVFGIALFVGTVSACEISAVREFEVCCKALDPTRIVEGRVIHQGLGLSYATFPNWVVQSKPVMKKVHGSSTRGELRLPVRLGIGDVVVFRQQAPLERVSKSNRSPMQVILEVQRFSSTNLNQLLQITRENEAKLRKSPSVMLVEPAHLTHVAGYDSAEYSIVMESQNLTARSVYIANGMFLFNFMMITGDKADIPRFEEFVSSIRLGPT